MSARIINLRGTSGSGKSHLVRTLLDEREGLREQVVFEGRTVGWTVGDLSVLACDHLSGYDRTFGLIRELSLRAKFLVFEGLLVSEEWKRTLALYHGGFPIEVLYLTVSIDLALAGVRARRGESGARVASLFGAAENPGALNEKNTRARVGRIDRAVARLEAEGIPVFRLSRENALAYLKERFR